MTDPTLSGVRRAHKGVALVIVLSLLLLLTVIAVAFFSRAVSDRQISNYGVNGVRADVLAQGAVDTVVGDLRQEIAAGSQTYTPSQNYKLSTGVTREANTLYVPRVAADMVPYPVVATAGSTASQTLPYAPVAGMENLVKQSAGGQPFFTGGNYDTSNYPPSNRAAAGGGSNSAGSPWESSSARPALNGRYVSAARWNRPLLLPAASATDATPTFGTGSPFLAPDWVLVARDGSNPTTWNSNLITSPTAATAVVGRYAYNVYDEGGLLDANVAGFPAPRSGSTPSTDPNGTLTTRQFGFYKNALAYADLTQLTDASGNQLLTQEQIDALVGWRNNASANAPGTFPAPGFTDTSRQTFYNSLLRNPTGFLTVANLTLSASNQSDRMFSGRQTLISLFKTIASQVPGNGAAKTQDALRFLGTFSRGLNQPSFVRAQSVEVDAPGYDQTAPKLLAPTLGGNNAGGNTDTGVAFSPPLDNQINPAFLAVRVPTTKAKGRLDGSDLVQGEPLVKKRFALNRLAWLTYKGASHDNMSDPVVQATITAMGGNPTDTTDPVYRFVQQGTTENIKAYFGLTWDVPLTPNATGGKVWRYNVHNGGNTGTGAIMKVGRPPNVTTADATQYVQDSGREPDFFELLKATINIGSVAKASTQPPVTSYTFQHAIDQYQADSRVDDAIIRIGANIIDQFDLDGIPTQISFNDGGGVGSGNGAREFYGVENLPYLYDVQPAVLKVAAPAIAPAPTAPKDGADATSYYFNSDYMQNTDQSTTGPDPNAPTKTITLPVYTITDTGLGAALLLPQLWNPHDWDPNNLNQTQGLNPPTSFRIYAVSGGGVSLLSVHDGFAAYSSASISGNDGQTDGKLTSPGYTSRGFPKAGESRVMNESNSVMTFSVPNTAVGAQLFREPTLLYRVTHPSGSGLQAPELSSSNSNLGVMGTSGQGYPTAFSGTDGLVPVKGDTSYPPVVNTPYTGMYLGTVPLIWRNHPANYQSPTSDELKIWRASFVTLDKTTYPHGLPITFYLQYQISGGPWITYDTKEITLGHKGLGYGKISSLMQQTWNGFLEPTYEGDRHFFVVDPRTSRFGMQNSSISPFTDPTSIVAPNETWGWPPFSQQFWKGTSQTAFDQRWLDLDGTTRSGGPTPAQIEGVLPSMRDGWGMGAGLQSVDIAGDPYDLSPSNFSWQMGFYPGTANNASINGYAAVAGPSGNIYWPWNPAKYALRPGLFSQNVPYRIWSNYASGDNEAVGANIATAGRTDVPPQFFADADGVVRRAMGGWADVPTNLPSQSNTSGAPAMGAWASNYAALMGLPMRRAHAVGTDGLLHKLDVARNYPPTQPSTNAPLLQSESRPMILNRPFRSVAELGYTFSGTPWRNLCFNAPESGDTALLDVFCVNDTDNASGLVAGRVNLNTRQPAVLRAVIAGAYRNESDAGLGTASSSLLADVLARRLVARTTGVVPNGVTISSTGVNPLRNPADLVGRWLGSPVAANSLVPGSAPYAAAGQPPFDPTSFGGFSADLFNVPYSVAPNSRTTTTQNTDANDPVVSSYPDSPANPATTSSAYYVYDKTVGRHREAPIRALASVGQTRVWNLLIDVVAQTGRYPQNATALDKFSIEGEQRYWVHIAIDRYTGNIIDKQVEVVTE